MVLGYLAGELDATASLVDQAVALNPNSAFAWSVSGWLRLYMGHHDLALEHQGRAMRLSPRDPFRLSGAGQLTPLRRKEDLALLVEGLRLAGIPE